MKDVQGKPKEYLNSIEEGNMSRAYYSEIGYREKKLNVSREKRSKVTMTTFF